MRVQHGSEFEREEALAELASRAEESGELSDYNERARGFLRAERLPEAISVLDRLVHAVPSEPQSDVYRITLGTALDQAGHTALARYHFGHLAEYGFSEEVRSIARDQLGRMADEEKARATDQQFLRLQLEALEERANGDRAQLQDFERIGFILLRLPDEDPGLPHLRWGMALLERGHRSFPTSTGILEGLLYCYTVLGPVERRDEVLKALEETAPESPFFLGLTRIDTAGGSGDSRSYVEDPTERAYTLLRQVTSSEDDGLRDATLADLETLTKRNPADESARVAYAFALLTLGRSDKVTAQAELLLANPHATHEYYFNLGQILLGIGDKERGLHHLARALELARTDEDRKDVEEILDELHGA